MTSSWNRSAMEVEDREQSPTNIRVRSFPVSRPWLENSGHHANSSAEVNRLERQATVSASPNDSIGRTTEPSSTKMARSDVVDLLQQRPQNVKYESVCVKSSSALDPSVVAANSDPDCSQIAARHHGRSIVKKGDDGEPLSRPADDQNEKGNKSSARTDQKGSK